MNQVPLPQLRDGCQLMEVMEAAHEPVSWYLRRRFRNALRKLSRIARKLAPSRRAGAAREAARPPSTAGTVDLVSLEAGDRVRVRSVEEIQHTLNEQGACCGCVFLLPMSRYCGREFRVASRVDRFFDERRWRMLKCNGVVLLEGVHCDGSGHPDTHGCKRMCFFFWRVEWLERIG